jgi:hypothetical protein
MKARTADVAAFVSLVKETLGMTDEKDLAKVRAEAEAAFDQAEENANREAAAFGSLAE